MRDENEDRIIRDLRPFPETPEAKAQGCRCSIVRRPDGTPVFGEVGEILYSITKGCPVPNHN
jgi:hypothetical protein